MRRRIFHFSFSTFNSAALWGTNTVWGAAPVTTKTWSFDFGHRVATHGELPSVRVWDDANHNGVKGSDETGDTYTFWLRGHTMNVTNELDYGSFDRDRDNLYIGFSDTNSVSIARVDVRGVTHMGNSGSPSFFLVGERRAD